MKIFKPLIIALNLLAVLIIFNRSVVQKEDILKDGKLILLRLAPADPRSLMQGDYMRLQYAIADDLDSRRIPKRGFFVVRLTADGVGEKVRIQEQRSPLQPGEYLIEYTFNGFEANIGAESFFFQEGLGERYAKAVYGGLRTDAGGNSVLIGLYNDGFKKIE